MLRVQVRGRVPCFLTVPLNPNNNLPFYLSFLELVSASCGQGILVRRFPDTGVIPEPSVLCPGLFSKTQPLPGGFGLLVKGGR